MYKSKKLDAIYQTYVQKLQKYYWVFSTNDCLRFLALMGADIFKDPIVCFSTLAVVPTVIAAVPKMVLKVFKLYIASIGFSHGIDFFCDNGPSMSVHCIHMFNLA